MIVIVHVATLSGFLEMFSVPESTAFSLTLTSDQLLQLDF